MITSSFTFYDSSSDCTQALKKRVIIPLQFQYMWCAPKEAQRPDPHGSRLEESSPQTVNKVILCFYLFSIHFSHDHMSSAVTILYLRFSKHVWFYMSTAIFLVMLFRLKNTVLLTTGNKKNWPVINKEASWEAQKHRTEWHTVKM
jgi:hypothetical protein